jgi:MoxR-like ATPase
MEQNEHQNSETAETTGTGIEKPTAPSAQEVNPSGAPDIRALNDRIGKASQFIDLLRLEMSKTIIGQKDMVDKLLIGLLGNGHVLLEGVPGLAKTLAIKSLSDAIEADFSRIQFTPDLLPADLVGTMIYNQKEESFKVKKGPVFFKFCFG